MSTDVSVGLQRHVQDFPAGSQLPSPVTTPLHTKHRGTEGSHSSMQAALQNTPGTPRRYRGCRHWIRHRVHMGMQAAWRTVPSGDCEETIESITLEQSCREVGEEAAREVALETTGKVAKRTGTGSEDASEASSKAPTTEHSWWTVTRIHCA